MDLAGQTTLRAVCLGKPHSLVISHSRAGGNDSHGWILNSLFVMQHTYVYNTKEVPSELRLLRTYIC